MIKTYGKKDTLSPRRFVRMDPATRMNMILNTAIKIAERKGYDHLTRCGVAKSAKVSGGLIAFYFGDIGKLKRLVLQSAIETENVPILTRAVSLGDIELNSLKPSTRKRIREQFN